MDFYGDNFQKRLSGKVITKVVKLPGIHLAHNFFRPGIIIIPDFCVARAVSFLQPVDPGRFKGNRKRAANRFQVIMHVFKTNKIIDALLTVDQVLVPVNI